MQREELNRRLRETPDTAELLEGERLDPSNDLQIDRLAEKLLRRFREENARSAYELLVELTSERLAKAAIAITRDVAVAVEPKHLVIGLFTELFTDLRTGVPPERHFLAAAQERMKALAEEMVGRLARTVVAEPPAQDTLPAAPITQLPGSRQGSAVPGSWGWSASPPLPTPEQDEDPVVLPASSDADRSEAGEGALAPILPMRPRSSVERFGAYYLAVYMACYHSLDRDDRRILLLKDVDGLNYSEIAEAMELRLDEIAPRIRYARNRLFELVARMYDPTSPQGRKQT